MGISFSEKKARVMPRLTLESWPDQRATTDPKDRR
jgi:hypothetical protein